MPQIGPRLVAGTSSFGMSGVNAHGLFKPSEHLPGSHKQPAAVQWQRARHWFVPAPHHLLRSVAFDRLAGLARYAICSLLAKSQCTGARMHEWLCHRCGKVGPPRSTASHQPDKCRDLLGMLHVHEQCQPAACHGISLINAV